MPDDTKEIARRSFVGGAIGGLAGGVFGGGLGACFFREQPLTARPPIIIKGSSLEIWSLGGGLGLVQQGATSTYGVIGDVGDGLPLLVELVGFSSQLPDKIWKDIGSLVLELGNSEKLSIRIDQTTKRVVYESNKVLRPEDEKHKYPEEPTIKELTGWDTNRTLAFGPFEGNELKFFMLLR